jgi:hypothetical protein
VLSSVEGAEVVGVAADTTTEEALVVACCAVVAARRTTAPVESAAAAAVACVIFTIRRFASFRCAARCALVGGVVGMDA